MMDMTQGRSVMGNGSGVAASPASLYSYQADFNPHQNSQQQHPHHAGEWSPCTQINYGVAISTFALTPSREPGGINDVASASGEGGEEEELSNPHQVPLEVGDEVYVFEVYKPTTPSVAGDAGVWYRGYVVSTSPHPRIPPSTDLYAFPTATPAAPLAEEPQVSVGIFPASHVQIRDRLDKADKRLSQLPTAVNSASFPLPPRDLSNPSTTAGTTHAQNGNRMTPLQEEDEYEDSPGSPRARLPATRRSRNESTDVPRPAAPLPNLKCGDETTSGLTEPLIDEAACALREWSSLLYTHLYTRNYSKFQAVREHFDAVHGGRKQLLLGRGGGLGEEEMAKVRSELVKRLVRGNVEQGLEVIVRHPRWGGLVEVDVEGEIERKGWVSAVRMYAMQVALAYSGAKAEMPFVPSLTNESAPASASNHRLSMPNVLPSLSGANASTGDRQSSASTHSTATVTPVSPTPAKSTPTVTGAKFYHILLDVRAFVANPCVPGETAELYFSLWNKTDSHYLTEEFCMILNHNGAPARESEGRFDKMKTLFRDLSQHDIQDQIYLVCRIVKNGNFKLVGSSGGSSSNIAIGANGNSSHALPPPSTSHSDTASINSDVSQTGVDFGLGTSGGMLTTDARTGQQSFRRPFGSAVLEVGQFNSKPDSADSTVVHHMPIFVPLTESAFSSLHEDIIASRIREIEKSPRAEHVAVNVKVLYGEAEELARENPSLLSDVALTSRLGFPDVTFPGDTRNEVFIKLWSGDFTSGGGITAARGGRGLAQLTPGGGGKNVEATVEVKMRDGSLVERVLSRGAGEPNVTQYHSMVFKSNNSPIWGELIKLDIPVELMQQCHLFITFRLRTTTTSRSSSASVDKPFAFAYLPLFLTSEAFILDGAHTLVLYRYDRAAARPEVYFEAAAEHSPLSPQGPMVPQMLAKTLVPLRDSVVVKSLLVSTHYTQNETLLSLLKWETTLRDDFDALKEVLTQLRFCGEVEVCKFLRDIFDALFGILISPSNANGDLDDLVFQAIVAILAIVSDRRFTNFKPVLDLYIERHFTCSSASSHIIKALNRLLRDTSSPEAGTVLRSSIKVWHYLFKFIVRSREIQRAKDVGSGVTSDHLEGTFKRELSTVLSHINSLMRATTPSSIIGTQTLAVQHFAAIIPDLAKCFSDNELADLVIAFGDSVALHKGKIFVWKLVLHNQIVHSAAFASPDGRAALVPNVVRWIKPSLGKFDEMLMLTPKDTQPTKDNARVSWVEGIRLAIGVVAAMLDSIQEAFVSPKIRDSRSLLGQEQDNVEYILGLLPRILESYRELQNPLNLESVERHRSQASVVSDVPVVFPSSYPFSLLARPPPREHAPVPSAGGSSSMSEPSPRPSLQAGIGEIACIFVTLVLLAPRKIFVNWLESMLEVEGRDNFARHLTQIFRVAKSILENDAYPAGWLNINILAHRMVIRMVDPISDILQRDFIPAQKESFQFNTALWRDFLAMLLRLLSSPQLLIEDFSPQKRRAVWRLAGDIRGDGAKILSRMWNAIGWPEEAGVDAGAFKGRHGGYQVQFVPGLVEDVLSLCLSHHDELRTSAVQVLYSMIISEYYLNNNFNVIQAEVIDRLDKLFMSHTKGDEISRAFFVGQLRTRFDESPLDDGLREQVDGFLSSINSFLDLLLAVRNLPEGEEYQEDRIISTLKLMSFIRGIGRSEIFVRYVQRLVTYHVVLGNETEAGLTLKLHADLHSWDLHAIVEEIPSLDLPRQTEFARKETLYMRMLGHLSRGKAWEAAIQLCKELQHEYETTSFNYARLAELLVLQSELYASIAKSERNFGEYFRVAFYGSQFPASVCGKQFIYRGSELEKLAGFTEKMLNKHPAAQLLKTSTIPSEDLQFSDGQFLQITAVTPEPDLESPIFTNEDVPHSVRVYYQHNGTNTFSFSRPVLKDSAGRARSSSEYTSLWTEKTVLICEDVFPTVLRRSEVVEIRIIDISPLENALIDIESKRKELDTLERRYRAISQTETNRAQINTNLLSMALNGVVDAPVNQGVQMYRQAFLGPEFLAANPDKVSIVQKLQAAIDELVRTIAKCMKLHQVLAPEAMQPFHKTLESFFEKNFGDEIARLPREDYDPSFAAALGSSLPANGFGRNGSISITTTPIIRHSSIDLSYMRRDSLATTRSSEPSTASARGDGLNSASFHIPALAQLTGHVEPRHSYSSSEGRSPDAVSEIRAAGASSEQPKSGWRTGGSVFSTAPSIRSARSGSIAPSEQGSLAPSRRPSVGGSGRKMSVLGNLKWNRKQSTASIMSSTLSEE